MTFNQLQTTNNSYPSSATYSITIDDKDVEFTGGDLTYKTNNTQTGDWWNPQYYINRINSFTIENVSISAEGINENTTVKITITITTNYGSRDVTYSKTIKELGLKKQQ